MVYFHKIRFEFDPVKSQNNKEKHGIDFVEAQVLWFGSFFEFELRSTTESRSAIVGQIEEAFWTAIITYRKERIRIISVRRSRDEEKEAYETRVKVSHR